MYIYCGSSLLPVVLVNACMDHHIRRSLTRLIESESDPCKVGTLLSSHLTLVVVCFAGLGECLAVCGFLLIVHFRVSVPHRD